MVQDSATELCVQIYSINGNLSGVLLRTNGVQMENSDGKAKKRDIDEKERRLVCPDHGKAITPNVIAN